VPATTTSSSADCRSARTSGREIVVTRTDSAAITTISALRMHHDRSVSQTSAA